MQHAGRQASAPGGRPSCLPARRGIPRRPRGAVQSGPAPLPVETAGRGPAKGPPRLLATRQPARPARQTAGRASRLRTSPLAPGARRPPRGPGGPPPGRRTGSGPGGWRVGIVWTRYVGNVMLKRYVGRLVAAESPARRVLHSMVLVLLCVAARQSPCPLKKGEIGHRRGCPGAQRAFGTGPGARQPLSPRRRCPMPAVADVTPNCAHYPSSRCP